MMTEQDYRDIIEHWMEKLVPGEVYSFIIAIEGDKLCAQIETESKRAQVAWSEISFALENMPSD